MSHLQSASLVPLVTKFSTLFQTKNIFFNIEKFQTYLNTIHIGRSFLYRTSITSTMEIIKREAVEGCCSGTLLLAESQSAGRGRVDREWSSKLEGNLYFSILLRPLKFEILPQINLSLPLAVAIAINKIYNLDAKVKW
jgi:BirA family biotin operon repressor/biotin-[acetyl-CoA-carboxylase] ligase